ncbi:MAG TPA: RNA 3'-terminal phosphate cyclase [Thermoanaerobaculia bacterium]|nr:RNA 3'-terminal phosphate cyclase [Thermoanaerobaculia bacterium]
MLTIDGSHGEGGGQIFRSSLSLSLITRRPFRIERLRAGRTKPGLLRQHLTSVLAAAEVGDARVQGAELGSQELTFEPRALRGGTFRFDIGSAGSTMLVLQTILVPLLVASEPAELTLEGGTHNPAAPTFEFLRASFLPLLRKMGAHVSIALERPGFFPAGGGRVQVRIEPATLRPIAILERGALLAKRARAAVANLPLEIAMRELHEVGWEDARAETLAGARGPGNVLSLEAEFENVTEVVTGFGEKGVRGEEVARRARDEMQRYLDSNAAVGEHLADQLLLPMAIAGGGAFSTVEPSAHTTTNAEVIRAFLDVAVTIERDGARYQCAITSGASSPTPRSTSSIVSPPRSSANEER